MAELDKQRQLAAAIKRLQMQQRAICFDPYKPDSRPTAGQQEFLSGINKYNIRWLIGGNQSGKSMSGGREAAWIFAGTHPELVPPAEWAGMPLTMMLVGRTSQQVSEELWKKKVRPFLEPGTFKEHRIAGGIVTAVDNLVNGNHIMFFSHHSPNEAREKLQSYTAHWLWLDEMPDSAQLVEELQIRTQSHKGKFIGTLTPKLRNPQIRKMIEADTPYQKVFKIGMLDNPVTFGRHDEILAKMEAMSEEWRNTILNGDFYVGDKAVYQFSQELHALKDPEYNRSWRHIEAIDPASSGNAGHVIVAENPRSGIWSVIAAQYIPGNTAKNILQTMESKRGDVNLIKRVCDPHENWFIKHAAEENEHFQGVYKKTERKAELRANLQNLLDAGKLIVDPSLEDLIDEFVTCQWSESVENRIIAAQRFHLIDALQYALDGLPAPVPGTTTLPVLQLLREANKRRIAAENKPKAAKTARGRIVKRGTIGNRIRRG